MLQFVKLLNVIEILETIVINFQALDRVRSNKAHSIKLSDFIMVNVELFQLFELFQAVNFYNFVLVGLQNLELPQKTKL